MARIDAIVLGAGIVGTSIALHLAKRGLAVALVDRRAPGEETSYGNAGVIEGNTIFPPAFPSDPAALLRIALKRAPEANYHLTLFAAGGALAAGVSRGLASATADGDRAGDAAVVCAARSPSTRRCWRRPAPAAICARTAGSKLYRSDARLCARSSGELALAQEFGIDLPCARAGRGACARAEPRAGFSPCRALAGRRQRHQSARRHAGLCGAFRRARRRDDQRRRALASPCRTALAGRHRGGAARCRAKRWWRSGRSRRRARTARHQAAARRQARLPPSLPRRRAMPGSRARCVDAEIGYCLAPMEQGIRLTTGAEFAARDAPPTPVQFDRLLPAATAPVPARRAGGGYALDGQPAVLSRFAPGDRPRARPRRPVARLWPRPLGPDARPCDRAARWPR